MEEVGLIVVEAGEGNAEFSEGTAGSVVAPVHRGVGRSQTLVDGSAVGSRFGTGDAESHPTKNLGLAEAVGNGT